MPPQESVLIRDEDHMYAVFNCIVAQHDLIYEFRVLLGGMIVHW
jgi:hypothetical protein